MNLNLKNLTTARASSEQTSLRTELRKVSDAAINAGQLGSIQHHKAALHAAANAAVAFLNESFNDYKDVVDSHPRRYDQTVLNQLQLDFSELLRDEITIVTSIVENTVPGIPKMLSPPGMPLYKMYGDRYLKALAGVEAKAKMYNQTVLNNAPPLYERMKKRILSTAVGVIVVVLATVALYLIDKTEILKKLIE